ncbi:MAG: SagB/ThcOx family dehydrogenase [Bacteroidales bacterium]|jgi:SagB-type dehydrogenase family enzyme
MKKIIIYFSIAIIFNSLSAQTPKTIILNPPDKTRGFSVMKALSLRASAKDFDTTSLKLQDISDLLWAANGINRPEIGKRTAPSAMNAQDIDVYTFMKSGVYLYNAKKNCLDFIVDGDHRALIAGKQENFARAPIICLLVSDISRFPSGEDTLKLVWAAEDAGIVSQNISIFCASVGFDTRPRASMDQQKLREILRLRDSQHLMLNNPVAYKKD